MIWTVIFPMQKDFNPRKFSLQTKINLLSFFNIIVSTKHDLNGTLAFGTTKSSFYSCVIISKNMILPESWRSFQKNQRCYPANII